jgi:NAD(P)-dependent dehydrogenase (short-subunit alcohol dehydrogenase family)
VAQEIEAMDAAALFVAADVSNAGQVEVLVARTVEQFGRLDFAVNNAATMEEGFTRTVDLTEEQFDRSLGFSLHRCLHSFEQRIIVCEPARHYTWLAPRRRQSPIHDHRVPRHTQTPHPSTATPHRALP